MKNDNDIIKRILLSMKYDSKNTLSENRKIILSEDCIPKNLTYDNYNPDTGEMKKGELRSLKYPELGKWGDGTCKCKNSDCLEFKTECCKTGTVTVEKPIQGKPKNRLKNVMAFDGSVLQVPNDATLQRVKSCQSYYNTYKNTPSAPLKRVCNALKVANQLPNIGAKDETQCAQMYLYQRYMSLCKDGGVSGIEYEGQNYRGCFALSEIIGDQEVYLPPHRTYFKGYFTGPPSREGNCGTIPWNPTKEVPKTQDQNAYVKTQENQSFKEKGTGGDTDKNEESSDFFVIF